MSLALRLLYLTAAAGLLALAFSQHLAAELHARPTRVHFAKPHRPPPPDRRAIAEHAAGVIKRRDLFDSDPPPYTPEARPGVCGLDQALVEQVGPHHSVVNRAVLQARWGSRDDGICRRSQARIRPYAVNGDWVGFEVASVSPGGLYWSLGFCAGDVLTAVNGQHLSSPTRALELHERFAGPADGGGPIEVSILRGGEAITLRYEIR